MYRWVAFLNLAMGRPRPQNRYQRLVDY
eukprot:SAG31_NODE_28905_length_403_cov_2.161184_1_plen_27_part_10